MAGGELRDREKAREGVVADRLGEEYNGRNKRGRRVFGLRTRTATAANEKMIACGSDFCGLKTPQCGLHNLRSTENVTQWIGRKNINCTRGRGQLP